MSYAILQRASDVDENGWTAIVLQDGRRGFVASSLTRSSIDERVDRWRLSLGRVAGSSPRSECERRICSEPKR
jgi:hypothetical protein